jgi:hypothetical protein
MSTGAIIAIVIAALIVLAIVLMLARRGRERRLETRRGEAREMRRGAEVTRAQADRAHAEADERAARARQEEAAAREQAALAQEQSREAQQRHIEADRHDPDVDENASNGHADRDTVPGVTSYGQGEENGEVVDRDTERDDEGDVVRDEEYRRPRST